MSRGRSDGSPESSPIHPLPLRACVYCTVLPCADRTLIYLDLERRGEKRRCIRCQAKIFPPGPLEGARDEEEAERRAAALEHGPRHRRNRATHRAGKGSAAGRPAERLAEGGAANRHRAHHSARSSQSAAVGRARRCERRGDTGAERASHVCGATSSSGSPQPTP